MQQGSTFRDVFLLQRAGTHSDSLGSGGTRPGKLVLSSLADSESW